MPALTRRHLLAGAAATAAVAAMPMGAIAAAPSRGATVWLATKKSFPTFDASHCIEGDLLLDAGNLNMWKRVSGAWEFAGKVGGLIDDPGHTEDDGVDGEPA